MSSLPTGQGLGGTALDSAVKWGPSPGIWEFPGRARAWKAQGNPCFSQPGEGSTAKALRAQIRRQIDRGSNPAL